MKHLLRPEMTAGQAELALVLTFLSPVVVECLDGLKGTIAYSHKLHVEAEKWQHYKIYNREFGDIDPVAVAEQAAYGSNLVMECVRVGIEISKQPEHVQRRFDREMQDILTRYGINTFEPYMPGLAV